MQFSSSTDASAIATDPAVILPEDVEGCPLTVSVRYGSMARQELPPGPVADSLVHVPVSTPWGGAQIAEVFAAGITSLSTPNHGGFYLEHRRNMGIPGEFRSKSGWYEEDVEWAKVALVYPEVFRTSDLGHAFQTSKFFNKDMEEWLRPGNPGGQREAKWREHVRGYLARVGEQDLVVATLDFFEYENREYLEGQLTGVRAGILPRPELTVTVRGSDLFNPDAKQRLWVSTGGECRKIDARRHLYGLQGDLFADMTTILAEGGGFREIEIPPWWDKSWEGRYVVNKAKRGYDLGLPLADRDRGHD